jgi:uncharacterized protein with ParB-like and HNH nuclease domain
MKAEFLKILNIIDGGRQYVVPLFQRTYCWNLKDWSTLWDDITEQSVDPSDQSDDVNKVDSHFFGSIVNLPYESDDDITRYLLIDGQQRLTTIFILLIAIREVARRNLNDSGFANQIQDTFLINKFADQNCRYKLLPTQNDRDVYESLVKGPVLSPGDMHINQDRHMIRSAYSFFYKKIINAYQNLTELKNLKNIITHKLSVVNIILDKNDNPYLVFESLNAKGAPLNEADLIKNHLFMQIEPERQQQNYKDFWQPMQNSLGDKLTEFFRHFLSKDGVLVNRNAVYISMRNDLYKKDVSEYLKKLHKFSQYYEVFLYPIKEENEKIRRYLFRIQLISYTTIYPCLLNLYNDYKSHEITDDDFISIVMVLENFIIRKFICNHSTNRFNRLFGNIYNRVKQNNHHNLCESFVQFLLRNKYPKDKEFQDCIIERNFSSKAEKNKIPLLFFLSIEEFITQKEIDLSRYDYDLEHILPEDLNTDWKNKLGPDWKAVQEDCLEKLGNKALTMFNFLTRDAPFVTKKKNYKASQFKSTQSISSAKNWSKVEIDNRSEQLAKLAIQIWKTFEPQRERVLFDELEGVIAVDTDVGSDDVTGKNPVSVTIVKESKEVQHWKEVWEFTVLSVYKLAAYEFPDIAKQFPKIFLKDPDDVELYSMLPNGLYYKTKYSADAIVRNCKKLIEAAGLHSDDWNFTLKS